MTLSVNDLVQLVRLTVTQPRKGLRAVLALNLPPVAAFAGLGLMAVASSVLLHLTLMVAPPPPGNPLVDVLTSSPFGTALVQAGMLMVTAFLVYGLGRLWGGQGRFDAVLLAVVWLQAIFILLQALQLVALVVLPPLSSLIGLLSIVMFFWLLTQFVTEVHLFLSPLKVFLCILLTILAMSFVLSFILVGMLGPEAFADV